MFDFDLEKLLVVVIVAIVVIGPKDLPMALRTAGRWIAKVRRVSGHFRSGIETMIREAELEEMEQKWREQNAAIMAATAAEPAHFAVPTTVAAPQLEPPVHVEETRVAAHAEPQLPLSPP